MLKLLMVLICLAAMSHSAAIVSSAEEDCSRPFVQDTLLPLEYSNAQYLYFCKDWGETLGVAAVKLELQEIAESPHLSTSVDFYWKFGNPYYNAATAGTVPGKVYPNLDGYHYTRGVISTKPMAYSDKDADQLKALVRLNFASRGLWDTTTMPKLGDTLHWTLSFIYFHSSKMPIWYWTNTGTHEAWVGSDTMTVRYRTLMDAWDDVGMAGPQQEHKAGPVLGRYDLKGRPLDASASPSGLVFERTTQGFRKRLQLR